MQGVPSPGTTKTIYYALDAASGIVKVFALLDQRRNPANRFRGIDESRLEDFEGETLAVRGRAASIGGLLRHRSVKRR